jgi:hypothetical protein
MAKIYELVLGQPNIITIGATGIDEILQNVRTILSTIRGTVPLDRDFGFDYTIIDAPLTEVYAKLSVDFENLINTYEPRAKFRDLSFVESEKNDGELKVKVRILI